MGSKMIYFILKNNFTFDIFGVDEDLFMFDTKSSFKILLKFPTQKQFKT